MLVLGDLVSSSSFAHGHISAGPSYHETAFLDNFVPPSEQLWDIFPSLADEPAITSDDLPT